MFQLLLAVTFLIVLAVSYLVVRLFASSIVGISKGVRAFELRQKGPPGAP